MRLHNHRGPRCPWILAALAFVIAANPRAFPAAPYAFSGQQAFDYLKRDVAFGPRPAGSAALEASRQWILSELRRDGCQVREDKFTADTPIGNIPMANLICVLPGRQKEMVMVTGHYDTKLFKKFRFVGANDGGSSTGLLLELARVLAHQPHRLTYWLVFFDGEEAMVHWSATDGTYGSRHMVARLTADGKLGRIKAMILVDMVAEDHLDIRRDMNSTASLNKLVFSTAERLGYSSYFHANRTTGIDDDHVPFVDAGVSAIDIIGLHYGPGDGLFGGYWHTAQDTVEHCSPASLTIVGRVVLSTLDALDKPSK